MKYTIDGKTYDLLKASDGSWSKEVNAPKVAGRYDITIEIRENGLITYVDSSDPRYQTFLEVIQSTERAVRLQNLVPDYISAVTEFNILYNTENSELDKLYASVERIKSDAFIGTASNDAISRREKFIGIKPEGTLEQRKNYLKSLNSRSNKLNELTIKSIANAIAGSDCIVKFFNATEINNPEIGFGLLRVQVLSPDGSKDYRYEDIERALKPLVPGHLKLVVIKYFSRWKDISVNFSDWNAVKSFSSWGTLKNYIPPM
jgi:hypothetical protein